MRWLLSEGTTGAQTLSDLDVGLTPYPIPPDVGAGGFEMVELVARRQSSILNREATDLPDPE